VERARDTIPPDQVTRGSRPRRAEGFYERVWALVRKIPRGRVMTYGEVAVRLGHPGAARAVGWALRALSEQGTHRVPWHRVVGRGPRISLPGRAGRLQRARLRAEGVRI
jgi:methylated-DNA-protein-cysteine methyltransferase-like protein